MVFTLFYLEKYQYKALGQIIDCSDLNAKQVFFTELIEKIIIEVFGGINFYEEQDRMRNLKGTIPFLMDIQDDDLDLLWHFIDKYRFDSFYHFMLTFIEINLKLILESNFTSKFSLDDYLKDLGLTTVKKTDNCVLCRDKITKGLVCDKCLQELNLEETL